MAEVGVPIPDPAVRSLGKAPEDLVGEVEPGADPADVVGGKGNEGERHACMSSQAQLSSASRGSSQATGKSSDARVASAMVIGPCLLPFSQS